MEMREYMREVIITCSKLEIGYIEITLKNGIKIATNPLQEAKKVYPLDNCFSICGMELGKTKERRYFLPYDSIDYVMAKE